jgi:CDP-glucose 4,6-dehydratase
MEGVEMNRAFWKGRRVLVTGHTGFKGSWLCLYLARLGAEISGYALDAPTQPSLFETAGVAAVMNAVRGDVLDLDALCRAVAQARPEVVIHMAAQALVRRSYEDPVGTYAVNLLGTVHLLEAVRRTPGIRVVINVTTDKCYENREQVWGYRESDRMGGRDPYSSSKACSELATSAYRNSFFPPRLHAQHGTAVATARAGNVIGGGDWATDRLIPDFLRAIQSGEPLLLRSPSAIRPWQHVLEPISGYLALAEKLWEDGARFSEGWNFGPADDDARPVSWVADNLVNLWGEGASWKSDSTAKPHEATYLKLDCSKARASLGWAPRIRLKTALEWVVEWQKHYCKTQDARTITDLQILRYDSMEGA